MKRNKQTNRAPTSISNAKGHHERWYPVERKNVVQVRFSKAEGKQEDGTPSLHHQRVSQPALCPSDQHFIISKFTHFILFKVMLLPWALGWMSSCGGPLRTFSSPQRCRSCGCQPHQSSVICFGCSSLRCRP